LPSLNHFTFPSAIINTLLQSWGTHFQKTWINVLPVFFNWVGLMQGLSENHFEKKLNFL